MLSGTLEINEVKDSTCVEWEDPDRFFVGVALFKQGKSQKLVFTECKMSCGKVKK